MKQLAHLLTTHAERILRDVYADFMVHVLAIPVLTGRKTAADLAPNDFVRRELK